jgi:hypothetical protein
VHLKRSCTSCHGGDDKAIDQARAHAGVNKRPSDDLKTCRMCHSKITDSYAKSLHYTSKGQRTGVMPRFSKAESEIFDKKVFESSCRSCHASCGDCHVKSPAIAGISIGLIQGHKFIRKDEGKTCAFCHGGRVYPEFTGEYGGSPDAHYQKGMACLDCHKTAEMHGDGNLYASKQEVKDRPQCVNCHKTGNENKLLTRVAHTKHINKVSCYGCHSATDYRNCYNCHLGTGSVSKPGFYLGQNPRKKGEVTTLRLIPTVRDTFKSAGIEMANYDSLPNYWNTPAHNIRKRTERTRSCDSCHTDRQNFLTRDLLIENGSKANEALIYTPKPIPAK